MTTFQDPQPQSRRAVRQGERGDASDSPAGFPSQPPAASSALPQYFPGPDIQRDMWDTNARRAAQLPSTAAPRPDSAVPGRRSAPSASQPPAAAEPLTYSTASRQPSTPAYDPQSFRSRLDARQAAAPLNPTTDQSFRVRDFSPEGRRAAQAAERAATAPAWTPPAAPTDLDYQTEVRGGFGMPQAPVAPPAPISQVPPQYAAQPIMQQPVAPPAVYSTPAPTVTPPQPVYAPMSDAPGEQTLSRRELRALLAEQEAAAAGQQLVTGQQPDPFSQATHHAPVAWQAPTSTPEGEPFPLQLPAQQAPVQRMPEQLAPQTYEATRIPELALPPVREEPAGWRPPVGHWSTQVDLDDDDVFETTISRRVGSGSSQTNALVLPDIPLGSDIRGPLTSTGEVMLTGSIDLPRSLSSTGASDLIEHEGIDSLFDLNDHEIITTDSQPVRAIKAVSTHQTGHGVTHTQRPKGTRALTVLLISASSMAVVVAGLLIAAFAFNIF